MRLAIAFAAIVAAMATGASAQGPVAGGQSAPTDAAIINICGSRLAKLFATFGIPDDVRAYREDDQAKNDTVVLDYGDYGFKVRKKTVRNCLFWPGWKGTIQGVKIGDSRDDVAKVLGKPPLTFTEKSGAVTGYGYELKALDSRLWADFDANGKVNMVEIDLN